MDKLRTVATSVATKVARARPLISTHARSAWATEDIGSVTLRFPGGPVAQLGMCLFQRDNNLRLQIIADQGTYRLLHDSEQLEVYTEAAGEWTPGRHRRGDRDDTFLDQARHFIDCIEGRATPRCTLEEGEQTLRTVLAALESADGDSRFVPIPRQ